MKKTLSKGLTNNIFIKDNYFWKKSTKTADYFIDRRNEQRFYQQTQEVNFIKIPLQMKRQLNGRWVSKMQYYPHSTTLNAKKYTTKILQEVKLIIDQFHQLKLNLNTFNPQLFLNLFITKIGVIEELKFLNDDIKLIIDHYYDHQEQFVVSHNDLIPDNFLVIKEQIYLIDFEYASYNHPLFDYASFISEGCNLNQAKEFKKILLLDFQQTKELENLILYQNYLWAHWAKYMFSQTKNKIYLTIMKNKISQILNV